MTAVPAAALPDADGPRADARSRASARPGALRPEGDTLDRIWSYAGEPSEDERWAAAFGRSPVATDVPAAGPPDLPYASVDALDWSAALGDDADHAPDLGHLHTDRSSEGGPEHDRWDASSDGDRDGDRNEGRGLGPDPTDVDHTTPLDHGPDGPDRPAVDDDRTRDHVPVGLRSRGVAAPPPAAPRGSRRLAVVGGVAAVVLLAAAGLVGATVARGSGGDADATRPAADRRGCPATTPPAADVDGDGCRETLVVDGSTVDAGVAAWTLGQSGDVVAVGDWDCNGEATAALLRPASGDVFLFATWADLDQPVTVAPADRVVGGAAIRAEHAGGEPSCDRLVVETASGGSTTVEVPG